MTLTSEPNYISFIFAALFTIVLSVYVIRRKIRKKAKKDEKVGWIRGTYITFVIGILSFLFFPFFAKLIQPTLAYLNQPRYEAVVVDIESQMTKIRYSDLDGNNYTKEVLMHNAMLEFTDDEGNTVRRLNNISSANKPVMDQKVTVIYDNNKMQEFSFRAISKKFDIGLILSILGYCLLLFTVLIEVMVLY